MSLASTEGLATARVLIIGVGGLGCPSTLALARAGVGRMTLVDPDVVERSNLHRQLWHTEADLGRPKVESAGEKLRERFPHLELQCVRERLEGAGLRRWMRGHELVLDGVDGVETKFELSDASVETGVPLIHAGVLRLEGQVMRIRPGGPCLRCLFEGPPPPELAQTCAQTGVLGSVAGVVGAIQARAAVEWLTRGDRKAGSQPGSRIGWETGSHTGSEADFEQFWQLDALTFTTRSRKVRRAADCLCANAREGA